jgi:hypothetical protein
MVQMFLFIIPLSWGMATAHCMVGSKQCWRIEHLCEICSAIRNTAANLPVIVVGPNDLEAKIKLFNLDADDYVVEPFNRTEFLARIDSVIRRLGTKS